MPMIVKPHCMAQIKSPQSSFRVLDQIISLLSVIRQAQDLDEAEFALQLEREMIERKQQINQINVQEAA
jgi:hypothetical protein